MKLRSRVTLAVTTVTMVTLALASGVTLILVQRDETSDLDRALLAQARLAAGLADMDDPAHPVLEARAARVPEHYAPMTEYAAVYGPLGDTLAQTPSFYDGAPSAAALGLGLRGVPADGLRVNLAVANHSLRGVIVPMRLDGYSLLFAASRKEVDADVAFLARVLAILLVAATALTSLVATWLGRRLASDVQEIAKAARDVASGNLGARVGGNVRGSSETRSLAADLDHMIEQLAALVAAQRTFISHAAHELMSPLATLRGELQLALRRPRTAEEHETTISQALGDVESLVALAESLLVLVRAEVLSPDDHDCTVVEIVDDALRAAKGSASARGVRVLTPATANGAATRVVGARRELSRALRNLVDNAVLHSDVDAEVAVRVASTDETVAIAVEDVGPGVPAADRAHIFEPFFRGARERGEIDQGAGLGLSIARQIANRFGGTVEFDSGFGPPGARFVLRLRRRRPA